MSQQGNTREKLVETAARLFHEQGFAATGIATILRESGVNSGSLYHFFPNKEALLQGVLDMYMTMLDPIVMVPAFAASEDPLERIFAVLEGYRRALIETDHAMGCPIGNLVLELADTYPEVRGKLAALFDAWCRRIETCLDDAAVRIRPDVDRAELSQFILTVMEGAVMQVRAHHDLEPFDASVRHLRRYLGSLLLDPSEFDEKT